MVKLKPDAPRVHLAGAPTRPPEPISWAGYKNALFLSCCESSVVPLLLQKKYWRCSHLLQNPGNIVPPHAMAGAAAAEIERAYQAGVRDFVVCGHHPCGVVRALLQPDAEPAPGPAMTAWLGLAAETRRVVAEGYGGLNEQDQLEVAAQVHVLLQLQALASYPYLAAGIEEGSLSLHGWVADTSLGQLFHFDPHQGQFEPGLRAVMKTSSRKP